MTLVRDVTPEHAGTLAILAVSEQIDKNEAEYRLIIKRMRKPGMTPYEVANLRTKIVEAICQHAWGDPRTRDFVAAIAGRPDRMALSDGYYSSLAASANDRAAHLMNSKPSLRVRLRMLLTA